MGDVHYMISEAAKHVGVESHVLRYWEEELDLPIGRTEMGHRHYTEEDIQLFSCIKEQGILLKEIKQLLPDMLRTKALLKARKSDAPKAAASINEVAAPQDPALSVYTADSAAALKSALTAAKAVLDKSNASITEMDSAVSALVDAVNNLAYGVQKTHLNVAIDAADKRDTDTVVEEIHEEAKTEEKENENGEKETVEISPAKDKLKILKRPIPLNDTNPLWLKNPNDCTDEEYKAFYRKVFLDYKEPLFWIHLNMDYPFNLKGILYFPKINTEYDSIEGTIKLYNNQVFIADNIKEVIPEFLMLLKGVIDCPDLPLNVSRSALQNDGFVKKIEEYITKKVADKLIGMCKTDKESYEKYWDDISPFIKYGCLKDTKFCDKMNDYILFKNLDDKYLTLPELLVKEEEKKEDADAASDIVDKNGNSVTEDADAKDDSEEEKDERKVIYYVTDKVQQGQYIKLFKEQGMDAVILDHNIDTSFISQLEQRNEHYKFMRIDADVTDSLKDADDAADLKEETDTLTDLFKKALGNDKLTVKVEKLKNENLASIITLSEEGRRMQDMMKMYAMGGMGGMDPNMFAADQTLTLNANHALVKYIFEHKDSENVPMFCEQLYDLAMLSNQPLSVDAMSKFVERSNKIMMLLAK